MAHLHLDDSAPHAFWDNSHPPRLEIDAGDTVTFECRDASDGQLTPESTVADFDHVDSSRVHALTGPVLVKSATPGDVLEVEVIELKHHGWGWNAHKPGFGLLADDFDEPFLMHWDVADDVCRFRDDDRVAVPYEPFCGVMGVAPSESGRFDTAPPRFNAGNVDIRGLTAGAKLLLPVLVPGAHFSCGDCHAAQGDGEVSGMGIESPMTVTLRFGVRRDLEIRELQFTTPSPLTRADTAGYHCTTAHGPDLYVNAQNAVRYMIDWLVSTARLTRSEAYVLCSVAGDLKISEIVDVPNWLVSFYFPLSVIRR
jgi:acetamidase/formamidase